MNEKINFARDSKETIQAREETFLSHHLLFFLKKEKLISAL